MLLYQTYVFGYTPLPTYWSCICTLVALAVWFGVSYFQVTTIPVELPPIKALGIVGFEMALLAMLGGLCYLLSWYREGYARWDYLQKEILEIQRAAMVSNQKTAKRLLESMLPRQIIEQLKRGQPVLAEMYNPVTVIFIEICEFSAISALVSPGETVWILNEVYTRFDEVTDKHSVYKVETVGEVYMAVAGCPRRVVNHGQLAGCCALDVIESMEGVRDTVANMLAESVGTALTTGTSVNKTDICDPNAKSTPTLMAHVGLNTGRINAGVVGVKNPRFKLFGDTVNMASRMESTCPHGKIQCSAATHRHIKDDFVFEDRGLVQVKGKGKQHTYFLVSGLPGAPTVLEPVYNPHHGHAGDYESFPRKPEPLPDHEGPGGSVRTPSQQLTKTSSQKSNVEADLDIECVSVVVTGMEDDAERHAGGRVVEKNEARRAFFAMRGGLSVHTRVKLRQWYWRAHERVEKEKRMWSQKPRARNKKTDGLKRVATYHHHHIRAATTEIAGNSFKVRMADKRATIGLDALQTARNDMPATKAGGDAEGTKRQGISGGGQKRHMSLTSTSLNEGDDSGESAQGLRTHAKDGVVALRALMAKSEARMSPIQDTSASRGSMLRQEAIHDFDGTAGQRKLPTHRGGSIGSMDASGDPNRNGADATTPNRGSSSSPFGLRRGHLTPRIDERSTLGSLCWPELHRSGRRMYQWLRCLTAREMRETNFTTLQRNQPRFVRFQHAKYYRSTGKCTGIG